MGVLRCSYVTEGENPPEECPNCHYSVTFWIERVEEKQLTVKDFVRSNLLELDSDSSVLDAAKLMKQNDAGSVLIKVNGEHVGIVTERDILYKVAAEDLPNGHSRSKVYAAAAMRSVRCRAAKPRSPDRAAFEQGLRPIHNHLGRIEIVFRAQAVAFLASAIG